MSISLADLMFFIEPNLLSSNFFRLGPIPGIVSIDDLRLVLDRL